MLALRPRGVGIEGEIAERHLVLIAQRRVPPLAPPDDARGGGGTAIAGLHGRGQQVEDVTCGVAQARREREFRRAAEGVTEAGARGEEDPPPALPVREGVVTTRLVVLDVIGEHPPFKAATHADVCLLVGRAPLGVGRYGGRNLPSAHPLSTTVITPLSPWRGVGGEAGDVAVRLNHVIVCTQVHRQTDAPLLAQLQRERGAVVGRKRGALPRLHHSLPEGQLHLRRTAELDFRPEALLVASPADGAPKVVLHAQRLGLALLERRRLAC